ncbi:hypothetical protein quinque_002345 [Culex quinquefasciatus]
MLSSKLDKMHNLVNKMRDGMNQVKQGVAIFQQRHRVNLAELRDYVKARLKVFYEEELDVPLVLFNEVLEHVQRIDFIFRQPQGHLLLIGVPGAGNTMRSRFVD